ncbi:MAG TPA: archaeosortase/exosortase family protein [Puia sp.]|nr:archaeosortase/exosortase family protein [Puia sp.]
MNIPEKWKQIPGPVKSFLLKSVILFIAWKIVYLTLLLPSRVLDQPLTAAVGISTGKTLNLISHTKDYSAGSGVNWKEGEPGTKPVTEMATIVYFQNERILSVADVCNGLELMVLYAGFIICLPSGVRRKMAFISGGLALIFLVNILRCSALALIYRHYHEYTDLFHHYVFTLLIYGLIFWLWFLFSKRPGNVKKMNLHAILSP